MCLKNYKVYNKDIYNSFKLFFKKQRNENFQNNRRYFIVYKNKFTYSLKLLSLF